jgi:hypothetical protein
MFDISGTTTYTNSTTHSTVNDAQLSHNQGQTAQLPDEQQPPVEAGFMDPATASKLSNITSIISRTIRVLTSGHSNTATRDDKTPRIMRMTLLPRRTPGHCDRGLDPSVDNHLVGKTIGSSKEKKDWWKAKYSSEERVWWL